MHQMIKGGTVITMDPKQPVLEDGAVVWNEGRIVWIGPAPLIPAEFSGIETMHAPGKFIFPGFVNLHTHVTLSILRGLGDDTGMAPAYSPNVPQGVFLSPYECYLFALLGSVEALKFGSTCIVDNYIHEEETAKAMAELGVRAVISERLHDADLFKIPQGIYEFSDERGDQLLQKNLDLIGKWNHNHQSRITCRLGPHAPDTCSTNFLQRVRKAASDENVGLVIHLAQGQREIQEIKSRCGKTPVSYLAELGLLAPDMIAGHCILITDEDVEILAQSGVHISHQSYSNAKGGMISPINRFLQKKINIGLGTDNMAGDMIEVMRMAVCVGRIYMNDPVALRAQDVLEMGTMGGARALGMENEIGSLEVGKKADMLVVDFNKPHLYPVMDPVANLVYNGQGNDIDSVFVDGECLVRGGKCLKIDEHRLLAEVQEVAKTLWEKSRN